MRKLNFYIVYVLYLILYATGCSTTKSSITPSTQEATVVASKVVIEDPKKIDEGLEPVQVVDPQLSKKDEEQQVSLRNGLIFAKADFQGVLKTSYVQLAFEHSSNPDYTFQLYVGEKDPQALPWDVKAVEPGYFFIELPEGKYNITSISIPVGSTKAMEPINVEANVTADQSTYLGTLLVNGTKERIKLGGVPLIKPGFEFTIDVFNEREEAMAAFNQKYPDSDEKVYIHLMQVNTVIENESVSKVSDGSSRDEQNQ